MLMSNPLPPQEGIAHYILNLSSKLAERGHHVIIITRGGLRVERTNYNGFEVIRLPFLMTYPFHVDLHSIFVNQFFKQMEGNLDLIHVHTPLTPALLTKIPIVATFHTPHFADALTTGVTDTRSILMKILGMLAYRTEKSLIRSSRVITAVSRGVAFDLQKYYGVELDKILVLGNAASDEFLEAGKSSHEERDDMSILFAGRLEFRKGIFDLIYCMRTVIDNIPCARLVIMGQGPLLPNITRKVAELGLDTQVHIRGFVPRQELLNMMLRSSIFAIPSYYEGLPTSALEAMACQLPVVATATRGNSEVVRSGETGLLVAPHSPAALAEAIMKLLRNPQLRKNLAAKARKMVEENFTWDRVCDRILAAYELAVT